MAAVSALYKMHNDTQHNKYCYYLLLHTLYHLFTTSYNTGDIDGCDAHVSLS